MSQIQVELQAVYGGDREISEAAWTSSLGRQSKKKRTEEDVARVVNMLADSKHSTPFESVIFRWWIKMPIAIDRQFMTHRLQSASGMSGRYRRMPSDYLDMPEDVYDIYEKIFPEEAEIALRKYTEICDGANLFYERECAAMKAATIDGMITEAEYKRVREFMRGVLPQHNMTERVSVMNLRAWCNFIKLRAKPDAQKEIQDVANQMLILVRQQESCKIAIEALERNGWNI